MVRLFGMKRDGRLYELSGRGWVRSGGTSFPDLRAARNFLLKRPIPRLPNVVDTYLASVNVSGTIVETHPVLAECEG